MLPGPVFHIELLTLSRRKRYYALRFLYGSFLLYLIWINVRSLGLVSPHTASGEFTRQTLAMLGMVVFSTFAFTQVIVILLITPALVAGTVAVERQRKTLDDLLASRLSSGEIVLGKLAARLLHLAVFLGVGLPIAATLTFFGGVDPNHVFLLFGGCATSAFLLSTISIAVSVHAKTPREAVTVTYLVEVVWLFGPWILSFILRQPGGRWSGLYEWLYPVNEWVLASSPFFVMTSGLGRGFVDPSAFYRTVFWMIGAQVLFGALLASVAVLRLRAVNRSGGKSPGRLGTAVLRRTRGLWPRPACGDDAIFWKERYVSRTSSLSKVVGSVVFLGVVGLLGYTTFQVAAPAYHEVWGSAAPDEGSAIQSLNGYLRVVVAFVSACWLIASAAVASSSLTGEREGDTWVSLIASPLTPLEIVRAKMFGAFWALRAFGILWLALMLTGFFLGAIHPVGFLAEAVVTAVYLWFGCALGAFFSLRARNSGRALTATIGTLIVFNGAYLLVVMPFRVGSSFPLLGVTPYINAVALMSYPDVQSFLNGSAMGLGSFEGIDVLVTCLASVTVYSLAAAALTYDLVVNFDDAIDRPRTVGGRRPAGPGRKGPMATVEELLDEPGADGKGSALTD